MAAIAFKPMHPGQAQVWAERGRFNVLCNGRRWGKTDFGIRLFKPALHGKSVGWFAPNYKYLQEAWMRISRLLAPIRKACRFNSQEKMMHLPGGGRIDFWSMERGDAGRGRKYHRAVVDEAAIARNLEEEWTRSIRPTLADYQGDAWLLSTPKGAGTYFHQLYGKGQSQLNGWRSWQMPTSSNPYIDKGEIEAARLDLPADAYSQEFLAEFIADAANPFGINAIRACLLDLQPGPVSWWGADLAKSTDHTVVIGLNEHGQVCAFQRWQSDWRNTVSRLIAMIGDDNALIDATGVGDPIVEQLQARCGRVDGFKFTSQSKQQIMEGLAVAIQQGTITFPAGVIQHELEMFRYEYTARGVRYEAPEGQHDDCVDALALAVRCRGESSTPVRIDVYGDDLEDEVWSTDPVDREELWSSA